MGFVALQLSYVLFLKNNLVKYLVVGILISRRFHHHVTNGSFAILFGRKITIAKIEKSYIVN